MRTVYFDQCIEIEITEIVISSLYTIIINTIKEKLNSWLHLVLFRRSRRVIAALRELKNPRVMNGE